MDTPSIDTTPSIDCPSHTKLTLKLLTNNNVTSATEQLKSSQRMWEHSMNDIDFILSDSPRQAAAVHLKNVIKHGWPADSDEGAGIVISPADRLAIKSHLVQLVCTVHFPHAIQLQFNDAVALIAKHDFPQSWDNLLPDLIQQLQEATDISVIQGVLRTCNSIFKRFRYAERSDALNQVIIYVLEKFQQPLLALFETMAQGIDADSADSAASGQLKARFACMYYMMKIYYSLIYQDLPEYFKENNDAVMAVMAKF
jgi:exportin-2 (importin alpha re-exporter)